MVEFGSSKKMRIIFSRFACFAVALAAYAFLCIGAPAQSTAPPPMAPPTQTQTPEQTEKGQARKQIKRTPSRPARVTMVKDQEPVAPQVVTIVHRLTGAKLLRYLLRQSGERGTVATIDPDAIMSEIHASIIAGWALEDGKTIAARLPEAAAEFEVMRIAVAPSIPGQESEGMMARRPRVPRPQPDLTVLTQDGKTFSARYVGLDGQTGLSVLQLTGPPLSLTPEIAAAKISQGKKVQLFAPERVDAESAPFTIFVRIGKTEAQIEKSASRKAEADRMILRAAKLSPGLIGGIACDESGKTLGIVEAVEGNDAHVLSAESVRAAARRVLAQQSSVPGPLLGIRGEAIDLAARKALLNFGWNEDRFSALMEKQIGILLTSVMPGTPAAFANLKPGDIIVSVDDNEVKGAEQFSAMLTRAGSGEQVHFTVQRPTLPTTLTMDVKLGGSFQPIFEWQFDGPFFAKIPGGLKDFGIETVALSPKSMTQRGGTGLLIVAVEPDGVGAHSGLREGDVIESIDGRAVGRGEWTFAFHFNRKEKHVFSVVREREKKELVIQPVE